MGPRNREVIDYNICSLYNDPFIHKDNFLIQKKNKHLRVMKFLVRKIVSKNEREYGCRARPVPIGTTSTNFGTTSNKIDFLVLDAPDFF